jgi:hypothetical protein
MNLPISNYQFLELLVPVRNITLRTQCLYWCPDHLGMCEFVGIIWYKACNFSIGFKSFSSFYRSSNHSRLSFLEFYISCFELSTSIICTLKLFYNMLGADWIPYDWRSWMSKWRFLFSTMSLFFRILVGLLGPDQHNTHTALDDVILYIVPLKILKNCFFQTILVLLQL